VALTLSSVSPDQPSHKQSTATLLRNDYPCNVLNKTLSKTILTVRELVRYAFLRAWCDKSTSKN
jgi:predicted phosphoadenosine phosphosulfate sulfurtransferase